MAVHRSACHRVEMYKDRERTTSQKGHIHMDCGGRSALEQMGRKAGGQERELCGKP